MTTDADFFGQGVNSKGSLCCLYYEGRTLSLTNCPFSTKLSGALLLTDGNGNSRMWKDGSATEKSQVWAFRDELHPGEAAKRAAWLNVHVIWLFEFRYFWLHFLSLAKVIVVLMQNSILSDCFKYMYFTVQETVGTSLQVISYPLNFNQFCILILTIPPLFLEKDQFAFDSGRTITEIFKNLKYS